MKNRWAGGRKSLIKSTTRRLTASDLLTSGVIPAALFYIHVQTSSVKGEARYGSQRLHCLFFLLYKSLQISAH